jgi:hypothetical protein
MFGLAFGIGDSFLLRGAQRQLDGVSPYHGKFIGTAQASASLQYK